MVEDIDLTKLERDTMIEGPQWKGPATLFAVMPERNLLMIQHDGETKTLTIPSTNHGIRPAEARRGEPWRAFVAVERLRHECARNLGMPGSADQLPHQLQTIYQVSGEPGRIRYMIADEPGGGKTVVASRIIQELFIQGQVRRVLVVVPAMLKYQWQDELKRFVNMESLVIEGDVRGRANPWLSDGPVLITSMDYAKQKTQMDMLKQVEFDLVVVDEAHNLNATGKNVTGRYKLGELLGQRSKHMLFLTATPHRGKPENFRLLLKLLEPDLFSDSRMTDEEVYDMKDRLFMRHVKDEMRDMDGKKIFLERSVKSVKYAMSPTERELYDTVTEYVNRQYSIQMGRDPNHIAVFAVLIIQKRMASSTHALLESLKRRRERLGGRLKKWDRPVEDDAMQDVGDVDNMDEGEIEDVEYRAAGYTSAQTPKQLKDELKELDKLIGLAERTSKTKPDTKLKKLTLEIRGIGDDKLLIFSEYRDTLDYLEENIAKMRRDDGTPYDTCRIDGTMKMADREEAQKKFRERSQIMLATDAAREGINLQFCHRMVNYDLPWTPVSLEQRMGRLHRYGQEHDVVISNMVADGTREGHVMETLFEKIHKIELQYPTFNVMGQVLAGGDLKGLMTDAIRGSFADDMADLGSKAGQHIPVGGRVPGSTDDITDQVSKLAENGRKADKWMGRTPIDKPYVRRETERVKAQRTDGEYLVRMVERLFAGLGGSVRYTGKKTRLDVPDAIRDGPLARRRATYDVPPAELFARGGRIYGHLDGWIREYCSGDLKFGSVFRDPDGFDGHVIFHTISILDKAGKRVGRLLAAHKCADGKVDNVDPFILHDMKYDIDMVAGPAPQTDDVQTAVQAMARVEADGMAAERRKLWEHRTKAALKRMQTEVEDKQRERDGPGFDAMKGGIGFDAMKGGIGFGPRRDELDARLRELERRIRETKATHETAVTLILSAPMLEGWVRVVPDADGPAQTQPTEKIGIEASKRHERAEGFRVKDVTDRRGIGYDLLSTHADGRWREIEVKARCDMSGIELTESEYEHAKNSKHAVIHAISNAGQPDEELYVISDPSDIRTTPTTVHMVPQSEIRRLADQHG